MTIVHRPIRTATSYQEVDPLKFKIGDKVEWSWLGLCDVVQEPSEENGWTAHLKSPTGAVFWIRKPRERLNVSPGKRCEAMKKGSTKPVKAWAIKKDGEVLAGYISWNRPLVVSWNRDIGGKIVRVEVRETIGKKP